MISPLRRFSDQFSSLGKLALTFHKTVFLIPCALLLRSVDALAGAHRSVDFVLCAIAVIWLASSRLIAVLRSFWPIFWQIEFNNQPFAVVFSFSVGAFYKLLGELLQSLSHLLQFLALIEWSRPRHIAAFGGIATEFFDSFQANSF